MELKAGMRINLLRLQYIHQITKPSFIFLLLNDSQTLSFFGSLTAIQAIQWREGGEKEDKM